MYFLWEPIIINFNLRFKSTSGLVKNQETISEINNRPSLGLRLAWPLTDRGIRVQNDALYTETASPDLGIKSCAWPSSKQNSQDHTSDHLGKEYERVRLWYRCIVRITTWELTCHHKGSDIEDNPNDHSKKGMNGHALSVRKLTMAQPLHGLKVNQVHLGQDNACRCGMCGCTNIMRGNGVSQRSHLISKYLGG